MGICNVNTKRENVIDVSKGIGIILVVYAHIYYGYHSEVLIYSFHMPLFFLISGMLFKKEKYPRFLPFLKKRVKRLLVPYVIYEAVSIGCLYAAEKVFPGVLNPPLREYIEYIRQILISNRSLAHVNAPLWFLPCLFLVEMTYYVLSGLKKRYIVPVCFTLACCGWLLESGMLDFDNMLLPWNLDSAMFALGFYAFGSLFAEELGAAIRKIDGSRFRVPFAVGIAVAITAVWVPVALMNGKISLGSKILNNGFMLYITGILGSLLVMTFSILLKNNQFLSYCGRSSFEIMASHYIFRKCLVQPMCVVLNGKDYQREIFREAWLPFVIVFSMSLLFSVFWNRAKFRHLRKHAAVQ